MMDISNQKIPEVAMIMANTLPAEGANIHWLISKRQVEYILTDIAELPPSVELPKLRRAQYQGQALPVISLEKYFGLTELPSSAGYRYIVTKYPTRNDEMAKVILRFCNPIRVRRLTFEATSVPLPTLRHHSEEILGTFKLSDDELAIIPDIAAILDRFV